MQTDITDNKAIKIDIEQIIKSKNPRLAKALPGFLIRYIKKILHQNEINKFLEGNKNLYGIDFTRAVIKLFNVKQNVIGIDNITKDKKYLFVSNHPQGGIDSMCLIDNVFKNFGETRFMVNDVLLNLHHFEPIFVPINLYGGQSKNAVKKFDEVFQSENQILFYPAGLVSRKINGKIQDTEWKKSFINLAIKYKRDIVPVYIDAKNSNFFYRLANFRKFIGIKSNIEMFYLPNEMYKQNGNMFTLVFGKPISYQTFDKTYSSTYWANYVRKTVYSLKVQIL
ncbi:MAG: hypothetical protein A2X08_02660 [Bacteroidetes bacterium GWA2_32_17]|nr:MAG: hypothetical protein A2X08_02660 [Bacteroidetes bacterium GWA2_32_17]